MKKETKKLIWVGIASYIGGIITCVGVLLLIAYYYQKGQGEDYRSLLRNAKGYNEVWNVDAPPFTYQQASDSDLVSVRTHFNLDSIAGDGDELSKIKNLMYYVHDVVRHDGNNSLNGVSYNAIEMIEYCKKENEGMNCRCMATVLNEFYLSMSIPSRFVTCLPKDSTDSDCHVINTVYSTDLNKWIWIDPTHAAYVMDENNQLLGIDEVRYRLINNLALKLNADANWNHKTKQTVGHYLKTYMAKNLYYLECLADSRYAAENENIENRQYVRLCPDDYKESGSKKNYITHNPHYFWQLPK